MEAVVKLDEAKTFFDYVRKKGSLAANTVNAWSAALNAVSSVLDEDERNISYLLENGDTIKNRLQNQSTEMSGNTINLYVQRSQLALKNLLEWKQDRAGWEKKQAGKLAAPKAKEKPSKKTTTGAEAHETPRSFHKRVLPIPTSEGESFEVALPAHYRMNDLARLVWALAVYAEDFDPADVLKRYGKPPVHEGFRQPGAPGPELLS